MLNYTDSDAREYAADIAPEVFDNEYVQELLDEANEFIVSDEDDEYFDEDELFDRFDDEDK